MSFAVHKDYQSAKRAPKPKIKECVRCGKRFTPIHHNWRGGASSRKYCYDPICETEREREYRQIIKDRRRKAKDEA